jgi:hypothetical protein
MGSGFLKKEILYFDKPGRDNTEATFTSAKERAMELGIDTIVIASTSGEAAIHASTFFKNFKLIVITHSVGLHGPDIQEFTDEAKSIVLSNGGVVHTATHAFGGVGRSVRRKFNTYQTEEIIANTLRVLGEGMKVVCEVALMAADAGLVRTDSEVICIAGTGHGADTAVVLQAANAQDFFNIKIKEIICKPRL